MVKAHICKTWIMLLYFYSKILFMLHFAVSVCLFLLIIGPVIILLNTELQVNELVQLIPSLATRRKFFKK